MPGARSRSRSRSSGTAIVPWTPKKIASKLELHCEWDKGQTLDGSNKVQTWQSMYTSNKITFASGKRPTVSSGLVFDGSTVTGSSDSFAWTGSHVAVAGSFNNNGFIYEHTANSVANSSSLLELTGSVSFWSNRPGGPGGSCYNYSYGNPGFGSLALYEHAFDGTHAGNTLKVNEESFPSAQLAPYTNNPGIGSVSGQLFVGSRNATSGFLAGTLKVLSVAKQTLTATEQAKLRKYIKKKSGIGDPGRVLLIGDSLTAAFGQHASVASHISSDNSHCITMAAVSETIDTQTTRYNGGTGSYGSPKGSTRLQYVYVLVGINNILALAQSYATIKPKMQTLLSNIRSGNAAARIILFTLTPAYEWMEVNAAATKATLQATWQSFNDDVANKVYDADVYVTGATAAMHSGDYRLSSTYNSGDGLHGKDTMSDLLAQYFLLAKTKPNGTVLTSLS